MGSERSWAALELPSRHLALCPATWLHCRPAACSASTAWPLTGSSLPTTPNLGSIYIRCKNSVQEALYTQMMAIYFKKDELINDP